MRAASTRSPGSTAANSFGTDLRDSSSTTFIEQLVRYGQRFQSEKDNAQQSLFGGGEGVVDIQHPVIPACQDWSTLETLGKEREMIGLYLSAHPLDDYAVIIRNMCKTQLSDLDNLESLRGQGDCRGGDGDRHAEPRYQDGQTLGKIHA